MNVLLLYNAHQTYTNTVFEHVDAFARFSANRYFFCHHDGSEPLNVELGQFDALVIHYCVRLPFNQISPAAAEMIASFDGLKVLFIQDEYDHTHRTWRWIQRLGLKLVFTVVPEANISRVYPTEEFPGVRFVSNLTGYVSEDLASLPQFTPPSARELLIGYRGRNLPLRYGQLGFEKVDIARLVKPYCRARQLSHDISSDENDRIYGPQWYEFMASCRAMLGSESGSNVFDWDDTLGEMIVSYRQANPHAGDDEAYRDVIAPFEVPGIMNQISPRIFESIALKTALVLFEGNYSGVIQPGKHFIPLRKDGSNLDEVFRLLQDGEYVDAMVERAYDDVIGSKTFSFEAFIKMVDGQMSAAWQGVAMRPGNAGARRVGHSAEGMPTVLSTRPFKAPSPAKPLPPPAVRHPVRDSAPFRLAVRAWNEMPEPMRKLMRPLTRGVARPLWRALRRLKGKLSGG